MSKRICVHLGLCAAAAVIIVSFAILFNAGNAARNKMPAAIKTAVISSAQSPGTGTVLAEGVERTGH